jgi:hypothetical protein
MTEFQFGPAIAGRHEPSSGAALSSNGVFELLDVVDDRRKVGTKDGVGGTDTEAAPFNIGEGRSGLGWLGPGGVAVGDGHGSLCGPRALFAYVPAEPKPVFTDLDHDRQESLVCPAVYVCAVGGAQDVFATLASPANVPRHGRIS